MTLFISVQQKCSISQSVRSIWKLTVLLANYTDCLVCMQSHDQHHACFESTILGLRFQIALADAACHKLKEQHQCLQFGKKCARQRSHCPTTTLKNMKTSNLEDPHHNPLSEDETELWAADECCPAHVCAELLSSCHWTTMWLSFISCTTMSSHWSISLSKIFLASCAWQFRKQQSHSKVLKQLSRNKTKHNTTGQLLRAKKWNANLM